MQRISRGSRLHARGQALAEAFSCVRNSLTCGVDLTHKLGDEGFRPSLREAFPRFGGFATSKGDFVDRTGGVAVNWYFPLSMLCYSFFVVGSGIGPYRPKRPRDTQFRCPPFSFFGHHVMGGSLDSLRLPFVATCLWGALPAVNQAIEVLLVE